MDGKGEQYACDSCTSEQRSKRGHDAGPWWRVGRHWVNCCPQRYITQWHIELLRIWRQVQRGHLPYGGGWLEQPSILTRMFDALDVEERMMKATDDN